MEKRSKINLFKNAISKFSGEDKVIECLQLASESFGYIPEETIPVISKQLCVPEATIYGVATFYSQFTFTPKAKYNISVCMGTACFVLGADKVMEAIKQKLNIEEGEVTADGKFGLEQVRCLGCCSMAPVLSINGNIYAHVKPSDVDRILSECE